MMLDTGHSAREGEIRRYTGLVKGGGAGEWEGRGEDTSSIEGWPGQAGGNVAQRTPEPQINPREYSGNGNLPHSPLLVLILIIQSPAELTPPAPLAPATNNLPTHPRIQ